MSNDSEESDSSPLEEEEFQKCSHCKIILIKTVDDEFITSSNRTFDEIISDTNLMDGEKEDDDED